jgi:hypothetical protein
VAHGRQGFAQEAMGRPRVTTIGQHEVDQPAMPVHGAKQVLPPATNLYIRLIDAPRARSIALVPAHSLLQLRRVAMLPAWPHIPANSGAGHFCFWQRSSHCCRSSLISSASTLRSLSMQLTALKLLSFNPRFVQYSRWSSCAGAFMIRTRAVATACGHCQHRCASDALPGTSSTAMAPTSLVLMAMVFSSSPKWRQAGDSQASGLPNCRKDRTCLYAHQ